MGSFTFPTGTVTVFRQTAAPLGWQKITSVNDVALRVVSGSGGTTGGNVGAPGNFSTVHTAPWPNNFSFDSPYPGSTAAAPAALTGTGGHIHTTMFVNPIPRITVLARNPFPAPSYATVYNASPGPTTLDGGGVGHSHPLGVSLSGSASQPNWAVSYVDLILASKF